jgi:cytochrome d ubiquinol oxidase subunit II
MWLNVVWFVLFMVIISGYVILDGFDLGVGILHLTLARSDEERRVMLDSIGPVWDGNEVWLVLGGGALFAAFPLVYAALFSGLYLAMMLVLLVLILRTVAIAFRSRRPGAGWRSLWDAVFFGSSLGIALLLSVALGNVVAGLRLEGDGFVRQSLLESLTPFTLLAGVTGVAMLAAHGALYLSLKTEGALLARVRAAIPRLLAVFLLLGLLLVGATLLWAGQVIAGYAATPLKLLAPAAALAAFAACWAFAGQGRYLEAFTSSAAMIGALIFSVGLGLYPSLLVSSISPGFNLTIFNAASAPNTLTVMLIIAAIGLPFVLMYTAGVYYIFRGKVRLGPQEY